MHLIYMGLAKTPSLPPARALRRGSRLVPRGPKFSTRVAYVSRRFKSAGLLVLGYLYAFFPLVVVAALAVGLVWGAALGNSP